MSNIITDAVEELLGEQGLLAHCISGYQARAEQKQMAVAIMTALQDEARPMLVIEAGTGVGKTFAYLAPALAANKRVLISTGSKTLQDQLYFKDLPIVREALNHGLTTALLKGRSNYLCFYRLENAQSEGRFAERGSLAWLQRISAWSKLTMTGDIAELSAVPQDAEVWGHVTSTVDNCLGGDCEYYADCYLVQARRKALDADVVVVNHHLFFADMTLKERGFGELLPQAEVIILDEAHQLPEIASNFFSESVSSRQLRDWVRDTETELLLHAPDLRLLRDSLAKLDKAVLDFRLALDTPGQRALWDKLRDQPAIQQHLQHLLDACAEAGALLVPALERHKGFEACYERIQQYQQCLTNLQGMQVNRVQWYETFTRGFVLTSTPLDIATPLQRLMQELPCHWVMTSATLAVGDSFEHFCERMGLSESVNLRLNSPFDYWHHALLYLPADLPEPQQADFTERLVEAAIPVINASGGRTFMLFTSYRALHEAAELLRSRLTFPLLVQGESPQRDMIERFKSLGNAVLLGTATFWEGVDVRGEALSCVIIDKLPFAAPSDPVLEARLEAIRRDGGQPFADYQLPQAVITLKQGVGRLIRDANDYGVLMIGDVRLRTRQYGQLFLESLPRMPRTQKLAIVERFWTKRFSTEVALPPTSLTENEHLP